MFHKLYEKANRFYESIFEAYGRFLAKHYVFVIVIAIVGNVILSAGSYKMKMITDADELFIPKNGVAKRDEFRIKQLFAPEKVNSNDFFLHQLADFGTWTEVNFLTCEKNHKHDNILQSFYLKKVAKIHKQVLKNTIVHVNNKTVNFESICARQQGACLIDGIDLTTPQFYETQLNKFSRRKDTLDKEKEALSVFKGETSKKNEFRFFINGFSLTDLTYNLGKTFRVNNKSESKNGTEAAYSRFLKLRYNLQNSTQHTIEEVRKWEMEFIKQLEAIIKNDSSLSCNGQTNAMRISYSASDSINVEITNNVELDTIMVTGTFMLIMFVATILMSINTTCVTSPGSMLPMAGIMSATFGVTSAFGFLSYIGYPACNLVFVTPFLIFGVGIDDMFIIYSSFTRAVKNNPNITIGELISKSLSKSGVSITITSLTDFTAFLVGIIADFESVRIFSVYVAVSILFCYIYQLTLFSGFLCIHAYRIKKNHNAILFCFKQETLASCCCSSSSETEPKNPESSFSVITKLTSLVDEFFKFIITRKIGKAITICVFITYLIVFGWSAFQIHEGLNLGDLVSDKSYYKSYINDNTEMVDLNPIIMFVIYEPIDYDSIENRIRIRKLFDNAQKLEEMSKTFSLNWMDQFGDELLNYKSDPSFLKSALRFFPPFKNDVVLEKVNDSITGKVNYEITASRFFLQYNKLHFSSKDAKPMHKLQDLCKESGLPVLAYSMPFKFYEQFESTLPNIIQSFVIATEAMFVISIIFIPDLVSVFCIILTMFSIMIGMLGSMSFMSLSLSTITMVIVIMSIGFCIDFSAHIVHAFISDTGKGDRSTRAYRACINVGIPIFNSAFSTFLGISLLYFCESFIFKAFFKTVTVLMALGVVNSLIFLPVLLSLIGPNWPQHKQKKRIDETELKNNLIENKTSG